MPKVKFVNEKVTVDAAEGEDLRTIARKNGVQLYSGPHKVVNCMGLGTCCSCNVIVAKGADKVSGAGLLERLWRLLNPPPALPSRLADAMPPWQRVAYHGTHHLMYLFFFLVPLTGWAYSSAAGFPIVWFGVLPLPDFVSPDKALAQLIKPWHEIAAFGLAGLVVLHIAAAIKHQLIDRDGLLDRMRPGRA